MKICKSFKPWTLYFGLDSSGEQEAESKLDTCLFKNLTCISCKSFALGLYKFKLCESMSYGEDKGYQISSQEGLTCLQIVKFAQTNFSFVQNSFCCFNWISNLTEDKDVINFGAKLFPQSYNNT